jgi:hypothetical protein
LARASHDVGCGGLGGLGGRGGGGGGDGGGEHGKLDVENMQTPA